MITISPGLWLNDDEVSMSAILSQGAGGQNVNKVASAIQLRFDIRASSLPDTLKEKLLKRRDRRISRDGVVIIKAQRYRHQEKNRADALERLIALINSEAKVNPQRKATKPSKAAKQKRLEAKSKRSQTKSLRKKVGPGSV